MSHWACEYIGKAWQNGAEGPDKFDCWGLVVAIYQQQFQQELPMILVEDGNLLQLAKTIAKHPERQDWQTVDQPREGDVALLRQSRHPVHVGIWLDIDGGGILHCERKTGVVFQDLNSLRMNGWLIANYYQHRDNPYHERKR